MLQIGKYRVFHQGGRWQVAVAYGEVISTHHAKWAAIQHARQLSWCEAHEKKPPTVGRIGGSSEPKSKWRRVI